ncbi:MAG TPA: cytidylate kinase family protein [Bryobacteraceae bacterium]|nr:cytidylate kinase family protein [Bryobacteraceae bacterium]
MALLTISGEPASRYEEVAQAAAALMRMETIGETRLSQLLAEEFGGTEIPDCAWRPAAACVVARLAAAHHLVVALPGSESLLAPMPALLRAGVVASQSSRASNVMIDRRLERSEAMTALQAMDDEARRRRKARFGRAVAPPENFDILLNGEQMDAFQMAEILRAAARARGLTEQSFLSAQAEADLQFRTRLELARHGIKPAGRAQFKPAAFGHPSEEVFANLLDFYGIPWEYEPRSFPLQWDKNGNVTEGFTPDFYLPGLNLYVEITTMKQSLTTPKNRKIKLLRAIYPHINIQVFYQKDFEDLIFKYGLSQPVRGEREP